MDGKKVESLSHVKSDIPIEMEDVDGDVAIVRISTPWGAIDMIGQVAIKADELILNDAHVQGLAPGSLGRAGLNAIELWFFEQFGQRVVARAESPPQSGSRGKLCLTADRPITRPVDVARALTRAGIRLATAHAILGTITQQQATTIEVDGRYIPRLVADLREIGVTALATRRDWVDKVIPTSVLGGNLSPSEAD